MKMTPEQTTDNKTIPVYILSGFLGSGKTTLLVKLLAYWKSKGMTPAVVMNELGEVNLDGEIIGKDVSMAEILGGCICCSVRGDLAPQLVELVQSSSPDVIVIEATGAANPVEILDGIADTSLYVKLQIRELISVVDSIHLLDTYRKQKGKTFRLMQEQIRAASQLLLNKIDLVTEEERQELVECIRRWNPHAEIHLTNYCATPPTAILRENELPGVSADHRSESAQEESHNSSESSHTHSHDHVMAYTHYFSKPINSVQFESWLKQLPRDIYRAKGIVTFSDTNSRFLFQFAYRETDFTKLRSSDRLEDVGVFIGEHFSKTEIEQSLRQLEHDNSRDSSI
ncbi:zinc transporter [Paenibacillus sp. J45TS6]|uniref:CobW family GTP-binding protein n=1 Tax=unclassified Paenibacillus TaxID=185978 RepID=UPI001B037B42|nr:CobW family GTP-binding protein [Paenibacillus sp. J45TS6]GIP43826.1 zinc transporter [Paenibacillus sp. J45TS6]